MGLPFLFRPCDAGILAFFRAAFGLVMFCDVARHFLHGWIEQDYIRPPFHFTYHGFHWLPRWPAEGLYIHFALLGVASLGIALGLWHRLCAAVFFVGFTYVFLLEKAKYLNHYYLVCLLAFLLIFLPAHRCWSLDAWRRPGFRSDVVPAWSLWLLRFHIALPYFYGGIAKINADWLRGQPMGLWMASSQGGVPWIGSLFTEDWMVLLFSWGGLLFDLAVVPMLLWRKTRLFAFGWAVLFHFLNHRLFAIGIFPWLMTLATLVFFRPDWPRRAVESVQRLWGRRPERVVRVDWPQSPSARRNVVLMTCWGLYLGFHLLAPLRHWLYPGDSNWTEEGHRFAWHMMLRTKVTAVRFIVTDPKTGHTGTVNLREWLLPHQLSKMGRDPEMMREFAHVVEAGYRKMGIGDVEIRALALSSLNGRKPQLIVDPNVDLTRVERSYFRHNDWIVPLHEPFRYAPWRVPILQWEEYVDTTLPKTGQPAGTEQGGAGSARP